MRGGTFANRLVGIVAAKETDRVRANVVRIFNAKTTKVVEVIDL